MLISGKRPGEDLSTGRDAPPKLLGEQSLFGRAGRQSDNPRDTPDALRPARAQNQCRHSNRQDHDRAFHAVDTRHPRDHHMQFDDAPARPLKQPRAAPTSHRCNRR
jgi:hypothetical protein